MPKFGLALSGGGFRATLFHLGVVRFLRDAKLLGDVSHIVSVSGGSVLGAHLALNWDKFNGSDAEFAEAASKLIDFVRFDVRNRVVRRIPFIIPLQFLQRLTFRSKSRRFSQSDLLEQYYASQLFGDACVHQFPVTPEVHILTTNISEGRLCSFTRAGFIMQRRVKWENEVSVLPARLARVSLAVTASSAFPGFFPPVNIDADDLGLASGEFPPQTFTDGGVYDNLGVRAFDLLESIDPPLDKILVSDAGKGFRVIDKKPLGMIAQAMRATDILWDRVGQLEKQNFEADSRFLFIPANEEVSLEEDPTALDPVIQPEVQNIRTDMDRFTPMEISALVQHGYCVARKRCQTEPQTFGTNLPSSPPWNPMAQDQTTSTTSVARQLRNSSGRRIWSTLIDFRDWVSYVYIPILILLFVVLPVVLWNQYHQSRVNHTIIDAIAHGNPDFRKVLDLVQDPSEHRWPPQPVIEINEPSVVETSGYEFLSDSNMIDLRHWESQKQDDAYFYRRVRVRKLTPDARLVIQYNQPFKRLDFRCNPENLKPVIRHVANKTDDPNQVWEIEYDLSTIAVGKTFDVEIEVNIHDVQASRGKNQSWLRYKPTVKTDEASVWVLFPEKHQYQSYSLRRFSNQDPTNFQDIETNYMISHPYGSIIAWSMINPQLGFSYECRWESK